MRSGSWAIREVFLFGEAVLVGTDVDEGRVARGGRCGYEGLVEGGTLVDGALIRFLEVVEWWLDERRRVDDMVGYGWRDEEWVSYWFYGFVIVGRREGEWGGWLDVHRDPGR